MVTAADPVSKPAPPGGDAAVLRVRDALKSFGTVQALKGASLEVLAGDRLALLGPNGAGKTTLLRAIAGRVRLDGGTIELYGTNPPPGERRRGLGIVPQEIALYPLLTARENLDAFARLHGVPGAERRERVAWALEWTGLADRAREPIRRFSGGMKRRLNIACGVLHRPRVVLLDEPTVGVDPQSRERIYEMLDELRAAGASQLLTTHQLEEAERRCDRVAILDRGAVVASGTPDELIARTVGRDREVIVALDRAPARMLEGFGPGGEAHRLVARVADLDAELPALLARVREAGLHVRDLTLRSHGLHEVFIHLTGKELRE